MKPTDLILASVCLILASCDPAKEAEPAGLDEATASGIVDDPADRIPAEGYWIVESEAPKISDVMEIVKRGDQFLVGLGYEFRAIAFQKGRALVTRKTRGDITFSDDVSKAYFDGRQYHRTNLNELIIRFPVHFEEINRKKCVQNIRKIQLAMRSHSGTSNMSAGDKLHDSFIDKYYGAAKCPSGGEYSYKDRVTEIGVLCCTCSLAKEKGHVPEDYSDW